MAALYGVETKRVNEAVRNNTDKFPKGYFFELAQNETIELVKNFDQFNLKHSSTMPKAFTEKGLYMLATILKINPKMVLLGRGRGGRIDGKRLSNRAKILESIERQVNKRGV